MISRSSLAAGVAASGGGDVTRGACACVDVARRAQREHRACDRSRQPQPDPRRHSLISFPSSADL